MRDLSVFPNEVEYLFQKQLGEAAFILLNKCDLLDIETRQSYLAEMALSYPAAAAVEVSALTGMGVSRWLEQVFKDANAATDTLTLDYQIYAQAEAALGWLNAAGRVHADAEFSILGWTTKLLEGISAGCAQARLAVAHVKVQVNAGAWVCKASIIGDGPALQWSLRPPDMLTTHLEFLINARISASPATLENIALAAVDAARPGVTARYYLTHFECFSPQPPRPTYRITSPNPA
jgi:hypothetical protein